MIALCLIFHILSDYTDRVQKYLKMMLYFILPGVQARGFTDLILETEKLSTKFMFALSKSKLSVASCNITELWKAK